MKFRDYYFMHTIVRRKKNKIYNNIVTIRSHGRGGGGKRLDYSVNDRIFLNGSSTHIPKRKVHSENCLKKKILKNHKKKVLRVEKSVCGKKGDKKIKLRNRYEKKL